MASRKLGRGDRRAEHRAAASLEQLHDVGSLVLTVVVGHLCECGTLLDASLEDFVKSADPVVAVNPSAGCALHRGCRTSGELLQEPRGLVPGVYQVRFKGYASLVEKQPESVTVRAIRHQRTARRGPVKIVAVAVRRPRSKHGSPRVARYERPLGSRGVTVEGALVIQTSRAAIPRVETSDSREHLHTVFSLPACIGSHLSNGGARLHHGRRAVQRVALVALFPAWTSHPTLQVKSKRRSADIREGARRLRHWHQSTLERVVCPEQHGHEVRIRQVRTLTADERTVQLRDQALELLEGVCNYPNQPLPGLRRRLPLNLCDASHAHQRAHHVLGRVQLRICEYRRVRRHAHGGAQCADVFILVLSVVVCDAREFGNLLGVNLDEVVKPTDPLVGTENVRPLHRRRGTRGIRLQEPRRFVALIDHVWLERHARF